MSIRLSNCLWFDNQAEEAAKFYTGIFKNSKVLQTTYYSAEGQEHHRKKPGSVMTVHFVLDGQHFTALNGGPQFKFSEAISFEVHVETQEELDAYWDKLTAGGDPKSQMCGWLKDRFGVSWQIVPQEFLRLMGDNKSEKSHRMIAAMMTMQKLDMAALRKAYDGA